MFRKLLSLFLSLTLCLCLLPASVLAAGNRFDNLPDAGAYLREHMIARESEIEVVVTLPYDSSFSIEDTIQSVMHLALDATSDPRGYDYLANHVLEYQCAASGSIGGDTVELTMPFQFQYASTAAQEQQVDAAVDSVIAQLGLSASDTDYDIFRAAYDYLCKNVVYDDAGRASNAPGSHSAYAALVKGSAVCQGYASALMRLLTELGVDCRIACGRGYTGEAWEDHAWNIVRVGSRYYYVDATWDAVVYPDYQYCLRGTGDFPDHNQERIGTMYQRPAAAYSIAASAYVPGTPGETVKTGWVKDDGVWHYYDKSGTMVTNGWARDGASWCWMGADGAAVTGWQKADGKWYFFDKNGHAVCDGWAKDGAYWCWMDASGVAVTKKWVQADGHWYYFDGAGHAVCDGWARDGSYWCWMDKNGVAVTKKWVQADGHWYYFDGAGHAVCSGWAHDGVGWCWMDENGVAVIDAWVDTDEGPVYFDADGHAA